MSSQDQDRKAANASPELSDAAEAKRLEMRRRFLQGGAIGTFVTLASGPALAMSTSKYCRDANDQKLKDTKVGLSTCMSLGGNFNT